MNNHKTTNMLVIFLLTAISSLFILSSCGQHNHSEILGPGEYYTCSMDPQVVEYKPGNCPICHMKLIKVQKNELKPGQIKLSSQQIALANITYDTLHIREMSKEIVLTGKITVNPDFEDAVSAKISGRIEKLIVKNNGDFISKGQLLYEIYSEDMNVAQQEYLMTLPKENISEAEMSAPRPDFSIAARNKLKLYGMSESDIQTLTSSRKVLRTIPVYAPNNGYVSKVSISEGEYIEVGATLFRFVSLHSLWAEAQVYLPYMPYLKIGTNALLSIPDISEKTFTSKVIFIDPQVTSTNRFILARFQILNPSVDIKPGMLINIILQTDKKKTLVLPVDAVIQDSKGANVWIRHADGTFENRMVSVGIQNSRQIEITGGLKVGDIIVVTGAYLLNSEYIFKKGANPMEGHGNMSNMKM